LRESGGDRLATPEEQIEQGSLLVGTVDTVTRAMERLMEHTPVKWIFQWQYNGLVASEQIQRSVRDFKEKVLPRVTDTDD
jgi:alkanesulfonate monooxygenase SsuD/methylene tetrahydromethanopterin reductase-like flavin-dependent oxidoreductase (luciferase family)